MKMIGKYKGTEVYSISKEDYENLDHNYDRKMYVIGNKLVYLGDIIGNVDIYNRVEECAPYPYKVEKKNTPKVEVTDVKKEVSTEEVDVILREAMESLKLEDGIDLESLMYSGEV